MNRRNSKQIKKKSEELVVAWLQTMLIEEEQKKLTVENFEKYLPEQTHIYVNNKVMLSAYTPRWHTYEPDFVKAIGDKEYLLEAKGRFWDYQEYNKYIWIRKALAENQELVFLFLSPFAPMPQAKKRKDGTKRSHAEWAETNNFTWYSEDTLPDNWRNDEL